MRRWIIKAGIGLLLIAAGGLVWAWATGMFDREVRNADVTTKEKSPGESGTLQEALQLAKTAQAKLNGMPGYRCTYLRDEVIGNELQKNYLHLTILHEPFSVNLEWLEPTSKKGRKAIYVEGKNNNKMIVKQLVLKLTLDPDESIKKKESRHTILEAGLKNLTNRFVRAWEEEMQGNETQVKYSDAEVDVIVSGQQLSYPCRCVETSHPVETKEKYAFHRVKLYFNKDNGLPVRMEGYDWPTSSIPEGRLLERYTYADLKTEPVPTEKDFQ
jgi:hypothetical protein